MLYFFFIVVTLTAYSLGAVVSARLSGRNADPGLFGTFIVPLIISAAILLMREGLGLRMLLLALPSAALVASIAFRFSRTRAQFNEFSAPRRTHDSSSSALIRTWHAWRGFAADSADFQARILIALLYFLFLWPFSFFARRNDPLNRNSLPHWISRPTSDPTLSAAQKQY